MAYSEFGRLAEPATLAGMIMGATASIGLAWRGRTKWEPAEEDVPKLFQKVGGVLNAVALVGIWFLSSGQTHLQLLKRVMAFASGILLLASAVYVVLVATMVYDQVYSPVRNQHRTRKIIAGFWMRGEAREKLVLAATVQNLFAGAGYDPDLVWPRISRALAKLVFQLCYLVIIVSGSLTVFALVRIVGTLGKAAA